MSIHRTNIWDTVARARAETAGVPASSERRRNKAAELMSRTKGTVEGSVMVVANPAIRSTGLGLSTRSLVPLPLFICPGCNMEMRLLGIEPAEDDRDLRDAYTLECIECGRVEVRSARFK
jgi:type III secretory pathway component EscU